MDEGSCIEKLMVFGLTRQEASIYLSLYRNGALTGYEAAKLTGISRSNVYNALGGLAEKGAAYRMEGSSSKYVAVPVEELCDNKLRMMEKTGRWLSENMPVAGEPSDGYITIVGEKQILDKLHHMLVRAQQRVYLEASGERISGLKKELTELLERGIKVVLLTEQVPAGLERAICYRTEDKENQIRLISDSGYVLTGELTGSPRDICLYSGQRVFVDALKEAMGNEIKLIELTGGKRIKGETEDE